MVPFLAQPEIDHIKSTLQTPSQSQSASVPELTYHEGVMEDDGSSDTYWPVHSDLDAPGLDLGWPQQQHSFIGPTEVTTLINPSDPEMPSIKEQARRLIKNAHHVGDGESLSQTGLSGSGKPSVWMFSRAFKHCQSNS